MKFVLRALGVSLLLLVVAGLVLANDSKQDPLTGTWDCVAHGLSQGDTPFTLYLTASPEGITGSVDSSMGSTELSSVTLKNEALEIRIDSPQGTYVLKATYKKGQLVDGRVETPANEKGTWDGKKKSDSTSPKT